MVHQHREFPATSAFEWGTVLYFREIPGRAWNDGALFPEYAQEDVPGRHYGIGRCAGSTRNAGSTGKTGIGIQVTGLGIKQFQDRSPVQEGDVDAAAVRGIVMDVLVVQLPEKGLCQYLPQHKGILDLRQADDVRQAACIGTHP